MVTTVLTGTVHRQNEIFLGMMSALLTLPGVRESVTIENLMTHHLVVQKSLNTPAL